MLIQFNKSAHKYGYSYHKGAIAASLPDEDCKKLVELGLAEDITPKPKKAKPLKTVVKKAEVKKAVVR